MESQLDRSETPRATPRKGRDWVPEVAQRDFTVWLLEVATKTTKSLRSGENTRSALSLKGFCKAFRSRKSSLQRFLDVRSGGAPWSCNGLKPAEGARLEALLHQHPQDGAGSHGASSWEARQVPSSLRSTRSKALLFESSPIILAKRMYDVSVS